MSPMSALSKVAMSLRTHFVLFGARGVLRRALLGLFGSDRQFAAAIPNSTKSIILRLGTTDVAAFEHVFVQGEYRFSLTRPPSIIIDAGANVGMSAVYFALRYPEAKIVAIEPEPTNFDVLTRNAELYPQIIPIKAALWNHEGVVQIENGGGGNWGMRVVDSQVVSDVGVRATTLPSLLEQLKLDHVDLLKIDVEGAECEILQDSPQWIGRVGMICAELHDRFRPGCENAFTAATTDFPVRWRQGELHCVARKNLVASS